ncbi:ribose-5-phosphate isomerase RpiA [Buchnera aphidicola (Mindarus keteleerifoliae)]|uniref:ribose-5-phosphate isomerase RpiA n=1 Tax=Buchnera aphidicola TaxID=9 RepID=UPI0031B71CDB
MTTNQLKKKAALEAIKYIRTNSVVGIGTGSTVSYFIQALSTIKKKIFGVISSSSSSSKKIKKYGLKILDLNKVDSPITYVDGADEINFELQMIKGGGAALTKEKIIAASSSQFICIVDESKQVKVLGNFPLPVEIIPMSYSYIKKKVIELGGVPKLRKNLITDNGNIILDIYGLKILNPIFLEDKINSFPGVVTVGLFSKIKANIVIIGTKSGVKTVFNQMS